MKYVIINGSPRKKNTWAVVKQIMKNLDGEFEEIFSGIKYKSEGGKVLLPTGTCPAQMLIIEEK